MKHLKKFTKNAGQIIRYYEMFIPKNGGVIKTEYKELTVLISCETNLVVSQYGKLITLDIKTRRGEDSSAKIGNPHAYVRNWGSGLFNYNGLHASIYTYQTEYMAKKRVHNSLRKLITKEYGAYGIMLDKLQSFLDAE